MTPLVSPGFLPGNLAWSLSPPLCTRRMLSLWPPPEFSLGPGRGAGRLGRALVRRPSCCWGLTNFDRSLCFPSTLGNLPPLFSDLCTHSSALAREPFFTGVNPLEVSLRPPMLRLFPPISFLCFVLDSFYYCVLKLTDLFLPPCLILCSFHPGYFSSQTLYFHPSSSDLSLSPFFMKKNLLCFS